MEYSNVDLMAMGVAVVLSTTFDLRLLASAVKRGQTQGKSVCVTYFSVSLLVTVAICALSFILNCEFTLRFILACVLQGLSCGAGVALAVLLYYDELHRRKNKENAP